MHYGRALLGGVMGGAVMSLLMALGRSMMGMQANLEMMLGTMFGAAPGPGIWLLGFGMHGIMPMIHPLIPQEMPAPGAFMANLGLMGIAAEFILHMVYGAIVGATYGEPRAAQAGVDVSQLRRAA